jgi:hypothetical protein
VNSDQGVLDRPASSTFVTAAPARVPVARRLRRGAARWHYLGASGRFAAIALLTAALALWVLDWALFDVAALAARLPVEDDGLPKEKLLLAARYPDSQVLYLGDSRILTGVDPSVVSEQCGCGPGYNGAFVVADTRLTEVMAERLLRQFSPTLVVIGVSQWALSDAASIDVTQAAPELFPPWRLGEVGVRLAPAEQLAAVVGSVWQLYRYRGEVRAALDPSREAGPHELQRGYYPNEEKRRPREEDPGERERHWFKDFAVRGRRAEALGALLAELRASGLRVILVAPPLQEAFHAHVQRQVAMFRAAAEQLAAETGAAFVDLSDPRPIGLRPEHFRDVVHLKKDGAEEFSRHLGDLIRSRLDAG